VLDGTSGGAWGDDRVCSVLQLSMLGLKIRWLCCNSVTLNKARDHLTRLDD
jgi:hypothetical protein